MKRSLVLALPNTQLCVPPNASAQENAEEMPFWTWFIENPPPAPRRPVLLAIKFNQTSVASL